jgi:hypothetical protein
MLLLWRCDELQWSIASRRNSQRSMKRPLHAAIGSRRRNHCPSQQMRQQQQGQMQLQHLRIQIRQSGIIAKNVGTAELRIVQNGGLSVGRGSLEGWIVMPTVYNCPLIVCLPMNQNSTTILSLLRAGRPVVQPRQQSYDHCRSRMVS